MHTAWERIEMNGRGMSGTHCAHVVNRRRPLIEGHPELGRRVVRETCMELARWWRWEDNEPVGMCARHKRERDNPPKRKRPSPVERYNAQVRAHETALHDMETSQAARQLFGRPAK